MKTRYTMYMRASMYVFHPNAKDSLCFKTSRLSSFFVLLFRFCLAAFLGGVIGLERSVHGRDAGMRTHLLVSAGSALFTILSIHINQISGEQTSDLGRIAAQVVSGIGFLGAGTIIRNGMTIQGLTTAACLWIVAALGMAVAAGFYAIALTATAFILCALILIKTAESSIRRAHYVTLSMKLRSLNDLAEIQQDMIQNMKVTSKNLSVKENSHSEPIDVKMTIEFFCNSRTQGMTSDLASLLEKHPDKILSFSLSTGE